MLKLFWFFCMIVVASFLFFWGMDLYGAHKEMKDLDTKS